MSPKRALWFNARSLTSIIGGLLDMSPCAAHSMFCPCDFSGCGIAYLRRVADLIPSLHRRVDARAG